MVTYQQRLFFDNESGQKSLFPGSNSSILRLDVKGACKVYAKLFNQSDTVQLSGINASNYAVTSEFKNGLFTLEISGIHELIITTTQKSTISTKMCY